jgi:hypothetical protein
VGRDYFFQIRMDERIKEIKLYLFFQPIWLRSS